MEVAPESPRSTETRARLVDAATAAFAAKGFHATTTRDIAAAAGMSPAALYVHHRSKEELLYLISRSGHEKTLALVRAAVASSPDPAVALRQAVRDFALDHAVSHTSARIVNYESAALTPEHYAVVHALRCDIQNEIEALVVRGVEVGKFDTPVPRIASIAVLSLAVDLARWFHSENHWDAEELADQYADIALRIVSR